MQFPLIMACFWNYRWCSLIILDKIYHCRIFKILADSTIDNNSLKHFFKGDCDISVLEQHILTFTFHYFIWGFWVVSYSVLYIPPKSLRFHLQNASSGIFYLVSDYTDFYKIHEIKEPALRKTWIVSPQMAEFLFLKTNMSLIKL